MPEGLCVVSKIDQDTYLVENGERRSFVTSLDGLAEKYANQVVFERLLSARAVAQLANAELTCACCGESLADAYEIDERNVGAVSVSMLFEFTGSDRVTMEKAVCPDCAKKICAGQTTP